jgi:hypothetical protein
MLVAGGSGIVPLMAMIRTRAAAGDDTETRLLYSSRSQDDVIYRDELERLSGNGLTVVHALTDSQPPGWTSYARVSTPRCWPRSRLAGRAAAFLRLWTDAVRRGVAEALVRLGHDPERSRPNASDPPEAEMDELMLDGNAVAGLLQEVFAVEMTTAVGTCASCGAAGPVGAVHVYRGAGIVLRCPHCDNVLAKIVKSDSRVWIDSTGIRTLEVSV